MEPDTPTESEIVHTTRRIYAIVEDIASRLGVVLTPPGEQASGDVAPTRSQAVHELLGLEMKVQTLLTQIDL